MKLNDQYKYGGLTAAEIYRSEFQFRVSRNWNSLLSMSDRALISFKDFMQIFVV